ncbi:MAG: FAD binding domain-containing protein [Pseudomonadales bacterium]|nr:FAD binding domain-containing protein [Pseudomonadales bacterium]
MSTRILTDFNLLIPETVSEALDILDRLQDKVTVVSGGTDVLVALKFGFENENVMSLAKLPGMDGLSFDPEKGLRVGAKTTIAQLLESPEVKKYYPAIWEAAVTFATPQIRNTATLVGNLLRGSPAGDGSCAVYALGGSLVFTSKEGEREVDIDNLWVGYATTARKPNELATELRIPAPSVGNINAFKRLTRVNEDLAKLNVAVSMTMNGNVCEEARVAMGCVAATLVRLKQAEALLKGAEINDESLAKVMSAVEAEITPIDDQRSTAEYRKMVSGVIVKRTIEQARQRV